MLLSQLLSRVPVRSVTGPSERTVGRVTDRHADVAKGDVFVAVRGGRFDGHDRLDAMAHASAVVVDADRVVPAGPTVVRVEDTRLALAPLAAAAHGHPAAALPVVAVTGTNGKTSTTFLLAAMARAAGMKVGVIGTTGHFIDDERIPTSHTTPDAPTTQALLARMRDAGCGLVAMEASSIGIAAHRVDAIPFRASVFTNLTRDHLDWHGSMEAYAAAKARLFHEMTAGVCVINVDDPSHVQMSPAGSWTYSLRQEADIFGVLRESTWRGSVGVVDFKGREHAELVVPLVGRHNVENALGALGAALAVGVAFNEALRGLAAFQGVPGRLQAIPNHRGFGVFVDYAHTDDALSNVLSALRSLRPHRIITVFGCGGDRDAGKRPLMGAAAAVGSDLVVVTSDNPRGEDPMLIISEIREGIGGGEHIIEPDRRLAINRAIALARPGDVVLIAGKGHESTQTVGSVVTPFDDAAVAAQALEALGC